MSSESSGADITDSGIDLTLDASWNGEGLKKRVWRGVQNTGDKVVYFVELDDEPGDLDDNRWQQIASLETIDLMAAETPIWARCADGETSTLAAIDSGRPTRYL